MPYGDVSRYRRALKYTNRYGGSRSNLAFRQGGTGAAYSGSQDIIRHAYAQSGTIETGKVISLPLVCYNPTRAGTPYQQDGSSAKSRLTPFCDKGSRVDYVTIQLTLNQSDTSKNNTCYVGSISTSFNQARLDSTIMDDQFGNGSANSALIEDEGDGEMNTQQTLTNYPAELTINSYSIRDILQHNVRNLMKPQFQLYSGRVITANQTVPLPRRNKRQQEGSGFWLVLMNDSSVGANTGTNVEYRLDTFFKEIPSTAV